jgi:hypothetical protein
MDNAQSMKAPVSARGPGRSFAALLAALGRGLAAVLVDLLALAGLVLLAFGIWEQFGRGFAAITVGTLLLAVALLSVVRR